MRWLYGLLLLILVNGTSFASCYLVRGQPTALTIPSQTITLDADAPVSLDQPFARIDSPPLTARVGYNECLNGTEYGRAFTYLDNRAISNHVFKTDIPGIGVKVLWTNGKAGYGPFPVKQWMVVPDYAASATFDYEPGAAYRLEFYKVAETLSLTAGNPTQLLPMGTVAYNYLFSASPNNFAMRLDLGAITLKSIPSCTLDSSKTIDFGKVSASDLAQGVYRDLQFKINCRSDYQRFSTQASVTTKTPSGDLQSIKVTDSAGQDDRLRITLYDSNGSPLLVDGTRSETVSNTTTQGDAAFSWRARLSPGLNSPPASGPFTAYAEIQFAIE
ncbi:spore coat protein U domain-containing protein [Rosenbergiella australiborealis]|uniref:Fimbrial major subunit CsuA/B family protein n=1 Tax=Rosenbergiella australiborealis TaxID=1544696 RepID=A0ABS5T6M0_9GAMM|nr:fimbrial protein [Rosenbergiella australiborealis]MBT0728004.1 fimbrial major subunit CsuA/B family protein [Rosenbergiella australiborealis]